MKEIIVFLSLVILVVSIIVIPIALIFLKKAIALKEKAEAEAKRKAEDERYLRRLRNLKNNYLSMSLSELKGCMGSINALEDTLDNQIEKRVIGEYIQRQEIILKEDAERKKREKEEAERKRLQAIEDAERLRAEEEERRLRLKQLEEEKAETIKNIGDMLSRIKPRTVADFDFVENKQQDTRPKPVTLAGLTYSSHRSKATQYEERVNGSIDYLANKGRQIRQLVFQQDDLEGKN